MSQQQMIGNLHENNDNDRLLYQVVTDFVQRLLNDERINHHFYGISEERIRRNTITYMISSLLRGSNRLYYHGSSLRNAHAGLAITSDDFEIAIKHFNTSLRQYKYSLEEQAKFEALLRAIKPHIINK